MFIIGIAGGSGSGKTTVAKNIARQFSSDKVISIAHDSYYRDLSHMSLAERRQVNFDHPDSLETELLVEHLEALKNGQEISQPTYDFSQDLRTQETIAIQPKPVVVVEGILVFADDALRNLFDLKIFVDTEADVRFIRRLTRDVQERDRSVESVVEQYLTSVKPMHEAFVEPSKRCADVIIPEGGENTQALNLLFARIRELM